MNVEKVFFSFIATLAVIFFGCTVVQTYRLHTYMEQCEQYRTELAEAADRQSEVRDVVGRTGEILRSTANTVAELRIQLQEVENSYTHLWELVCSDDSNIPDTEVE